MRVLPVLSNTNNNVNYAPSQRQIRTKQCLNNLAAMDTVSFTSNSESLARKLLTKIINACRIRKSGQTLKPQEFFLAELEKLRGEDHFKIFSPTGEIVHEQKPGDYQLNSEILKKANGNVVLTSMHDQIRIENLLNLLEVGTNKVFANVQKDSKSQIFTLPKPTDELLTKAHAMHLGLQGAIDKKIHEMIFAKVLENEEQGIRAIMVIDGEKESAKLEKICFEDFIEQLGITKEEIPYLKTETSTSK